MAELPQELIDTIVELVLAKDLIACALTARSFVECSQRRIFYMMSLSGLPAYERMSIILAKSPHLGQYVRLLALEIEGIPENWRPLEVIVSTFLELERVTIRGNLVGTAPSELGQNPPLIDLLSLPSLLCVGLANLINVPASLITKALENAEEVSLSRVSIASDDPTPTESPNPTSDFLWHLDISDAMEEIMPFLLQPRRVGYLQYLSRLSITIVPISESMRGEFTAALAACAPTLERLELEFVSPFSLPQLPALWHLELGFHADDALGFCASISLALMSTPSLGVLVVSVRERPHRHLVNWHLLPAAPVPEWAALDTQLCEMHTRAEGESPEPRDDDQPPDDDEDFDPRLEEVHFSLRYLLPEPDRYTAFVAAVKGKLPSVFGAEFLAFSYRNAFLHPMDRFSQDYDY
ncbi:hypothetical protein MSAN_02012700 [Mycena sanguinolenta]|uniref:F-box domain-containing protein n=1 Tax=Mycena sanguinolenta TaxID=230812 RepID=A0A8H6XJX1_9AGAR|nr:hypothetical protein MSAN_02012700 [Mycena sanguinolenta]